MQERPLADEVEVVGEGMGAVDRVMVLPRQEAPFVLQTRALLPLQHGPLAPARPRPLQPRVHEHEGLESHEADGPQRPGHGIAGAETGDDDHCHRGQEHRHARVAQPRTAASQASPMALDAGQSAIETCDCVGVGVHGSAQGAGASTTHHCSAEAKGVSQVGAIPRNRARWATSVAGK